MKLERELNFTSVSQQEAGLRTLGTEGLFLFSSLDTDHDLYLSPEEFKPIAEKLTGLADFFGPLPGPTPFPTL